MNIQRYLLPATIAAVLHTALLLGFRKEPGPVIAHLVKLTPEPPPPKKEDETIVMPSEDKPDTSKPVRPLAGGPTPPELAPTPMVPKPDAWAVPIEDRPRKWIKNINIIPTALGLGETDLTEPGEGKWSGVFSPTDLDRIPRATVQLPPDYPAAMHQASIGGSVTVEFYVNREGRVIRAEAVRYSRREFAGPAVRAVLKWHFEPGRRNGRAVPFRMAIPIQFGLAAD